MFISGMVSKLSDYVGLLFVGCMATMAASAFFFITTSQFDKNWRTSVLVSGLITLCCTLFLHERLLGCIWGITYFSAMLTGF
jgi:ABC-type uncharacterized transport system permease subunit